MTRETYELEKIINKKLFSPYSQNIKIMSKIMKIKMNQKITITIKIIIITTIIIIKMKIIMNIIINISLKKLKLISLSE